jgi:Outer membrane protein beta-barrel domain
MVQRISTCLALTIILLWAQTGFSQRIHSGDIEVAGTVGYTGSFPDVGLVILAGALSVDPTAALVESATPNWNLGVTGGAGIADNLLVIGNVTHSKVFSGTLVTSGVPVDLGASLTEITGGVEYLVQTGDSAVVPFVGAGAGVARFSAGGSVLGTSFSDSQSDATFNVGGGVRVYLNDRFGLRPAVYLVHVPDETFWRAGVGVFTTF